MLRDDRQLSPVSAMGTIAEELTKLGFENREFNGRNKKYGEPRLAVKGGLTAVHNYRIMYGRRAEMEETKLTVRVSRDLLENVKRYATLNHTTLTALIEAYLRRIPAQYPLEDAPIVRRLSGVLPSDVSIQDYKDHLDEKYGQ